MGRRPSQIMCLLLNIMVSVPFSHFAISGQSSALDECIQLHLTTFLQDTFVIPLSQRPAPPSILQDPNVPFRPVTW